MIRSITQIVSISVGTAALAVAMALAQPLPAAAQDAGAGRAGGPAGRTPPLLFTTDAWEDGGILPDRYTREAGDTAPSPALRWSQAPPGTRSFVVLFHDPEAVIDRSPSLDITHWLIWNIPPTATGLPEGVAAGTLPDGSRQVSRRTNSYMPPGQPRPPYHHYTFELFALDAMLDVPQGPPEQVNQIRTAVMAAMGGHVLARAVLVSRFHR